MSSPWASTEIYRQRLDICSTCEQFQAIVKMCKSCGCFMPAKAKIAQIRCPEDKWREVYGTGDSPPSTFSLAASVSPEDKVESLKRQAEHLKEESEKLMLEASEIENRNKDG